MMPANKGKIFSQYEIITIMFYFTMVLLHPIILVITYLFDIASVVDVLKFSFWLMIGILSLTLVGGVLLLTQKDRLKRRVKPAYRNEYITLLFLSAFGLLGFAVLYDYLGGNRQYIANVLTAILALMVYVLIVLGRKYFKFDYMRQK
ncbi:MAG: hypothetical protein GX582_01035 [Acholeplasmataceae bacterium]|nr:hypothetical protein [Acholeplasmataceae bacterium]